MHEASKAVRQPSSPTDSAPRSRISPVKAFAALLAVLVVAGAALLFLKHEADPPTTGIPPSDNFALTDSEAIATFKDLRSTLITGYHSTDQSLASSAVAADSPMLPIVHDEITELQSDQVRDKTRFSTRSIHVKTSTSDEVLLLEHVDVFPKFIGQSKSSPSEDITTSRAQRQVIEWTLKRYSSQWLIYQSVITSSRNLP